MMISIIAKLLTINNAVRDARSRDGAEIWGHAGDIPEIL
jgi:hypothetical protein